MLTKKEILSDLVVVVSVGNWQLASSYINILSPEAVISGEESRSEGCVDGSAPSFLDLYEWRPEERKHSQACTSFQILRAHRRCGFALSKQRKIK